MLLIASGVVSLTRSAAINTLESSTNPDAFFHVSGEVLIDNCLCADRFHRHDYVRDISAFHLRRLEHGDRAVVLLDDELDALPNSIQHGM